MNSHPNIAHDRFPRQTSVLGHSLEFYVPDMQSAKALVVRADAEEPFVLIARFEDGRMIITGEFPTTCPDQTSQVGQRVRVMFHEERPELHGAIVRNDANGNLVTVIRLDDGRHVLGTECEFQPIYF
jgi:hypothetical protein